MKAVIAGNWKMNTTPEEGAVLARGLRDLLLDLPAVLRCDVLEALDTSILEADEVDAHWGRHGLTHFTRLKRQCRFFERSDHVAAPEVAEVTAVRRGSRILAVLTRQRLEAFAGNRSGTDVREERSHAVLLLRRSLERHLEHDVPSAYLDGRSFLLVAGTQLLVGHEGVDLDHRVTQLEHHRLCDLLEDQGLHVEVAEERVFVGGLRQERVVDPELGERLHDARLGGKILLVDQEFDGLIHHESVRADPGDDAFVAGIGTTRTHGEGRADGDEKAGRLHDLHGLRTSLFHVLQATPHPDARN